MMFQPSIQAPMLDKGDAVENSLTTATVQSFLPRAQLAVLSSNCRGEEGQYFLQKLIDLTRLIEAMPVTYEQDGKGDQAIAYLHYFAGSCDWYITEKDINGGIRQAYGYAILNGDKEMAECGYISIEEITGCGAELDLHFLPCTLAEIKAERTVTNASTDDGKGY